MTWRLLDLFCGAGGAAMGYHMAGFEVVGVDHKPQPHFPFEFHQADAFEFFEAHGSEFDAIHASPPCQRFSICRTMHGNGQSHPDFLTPIQNILRESGKPYVIENVPGAPLREPVILCGTMFALKIMRHRLFESSVFLWDVPSCQHRGRFGPRGVVSSFENGDYISVAGHNFKAEDGRVAMGIDWMTRDELAQAIPPAYTEWIGQQLITRLTR